MKLFISLIVYRKTKSFLCSLNPIICSTMENKQANELIQWLTQQINHANEVISESHRTNNFGRETMYEGMRDAFMRCLNMLNKDKLAA